MLSNSANRSKRNGMVIHPSSLANFNSNNTDFNNSPSSLRPSSANLSLNSYLDDDSSSNSTIQIFNSSTESLNTKSHRSSLRLSMSSIFDKENVYSPKNSLKDQRLLDTPQRKRLSSSTPSKTTTNKRNNSLSQKDINIVNNNSSNRNSNRLSIKSVHSNYSNHSTSKSNKSHKSSKSFSSNRLSVDTFQSQTSNAISEFKTQPITEENAGMKNENIEEDFNIEKLKLSNEDFQINNENYNKSLNAGSNPLEKKKSITPSISTSSSIFNLRHSLSLRSLASIARSESKDADNTFSANQNYSKHYDNSSSRQSLDPKTIPKKKISLDNFRTFINNRRGSVDHLQTQQISHHQSEYKNNISLPIPQQNTRDKLKHKLKNSSSLLSISSFASNSNSIISTDTAETTYMKTDELDELHFNLLLKLCNQSRAVSFRSFLNKFQTLTPRNHLTYLKKGTYGHIILESSCTENGSNTSNENLEPNGVWKIIPFANSKTLQMSTIQIIQELSLTMSMSSNPNFITFKNAKIVHGPCPTSIIEMIPDLNSESNGPVLRNKSQLFLILRLEFAGNSLKNFEFRNWKEAETVFRQVLIAMSTSEISNGFEHRDLHSENIMIKRNRNNELEVKLIDFALSRGITGGQCMYRNLYDADFFKGKGEYRYDLYRMMRKIMSIDDDRKINNSLRNDSISHSNSSMSLNSTLYGTTSKLDTVDWSKSCSKNNLLWLHYLLYILINEKNLKPIRMNPILKKTNKLVNSTDLKDDIECYEKLLNCFKILDPSILFKQKKVKFMKDFDNVLDFKNWYFGLD